MIVRAYQISDVIVAQNGDKLYDTSRYPYFLCVECGLEIVKPALRESQELIPMYSWQLSGDDTCDVCLEVIP